MTLMVYSSNFLNTTAGSTVSAWIYVDSLSSTNIIYSSYDYQTGPSKGTILQVQTNGIIRFTVHDGDCGTMYPADPNCTGVTEIYSTSTIPINTWTHVVGVVGGSGNPMVLYINGVAEAFTSTMRSVGYWAGKQPLIGATNYVVNGTSYGPESYFDGKIDQVRFFNAAIDQPTVAALYNETSTTATYDYISVTPFYAGGASGGVSAGYSQIPGSDGGGGAGASGDNGAPITGVTNLGAGGGGGAASTPGVAGGSGLVVFRLPTAAYATGYTTGSPTITADGSDTILKYTGSGTYGHNMAMPAFLNYLVIAGGASGSSNGGGGGAGGLRTSYGGTSGGGAGAESAATLSAGTYTITIGAGGAAQTTYQDRGLAGSASSISGNLTVNTVGGGGGGSNNTPDGISGGSGGGAGTTPSGGGHSGGAGTSNEGFAGGNTGSNGHPYVGAGGGGSGAAASNVTTTPGVGGTGLSVSINGSSTAYAGGGGGSGGTQGAAGGAGGSGGGGQGGTGSAGQSGYAATANTGSGGGASGDGGNSGAGGSGIIILRMATSHYSGTTTGSPGVTTDGSSTILTYTGSGTYVHS